MIYYRCVQKIKTNSGLITAYTLQSNTGEVVTVDKNMLKQQLNTGNIKVINLKLTSDNKLIDDALGEIEHELVSIHFPAISERYNVDIKRHNIEYSSWAEVYRIFVVARIKPDQAKFVITDVYKKQVHIPEQERRTIIPAKNVNASCAYTIMDRNKNKYTLTRDNLLNNHILTIGNADIKFILTYTPATKRWAGPSVHSFTPASTIVEHPYSDEVLTAIHADRSQLAAIKPITDNKPLSNKQKLENLVKLCAEYKQQHGQTKHKLFKDAKYSYLDSYGDCNWHDCEPERILHTPSSDDWLGIQTSISSLQVSDVSYDEDDGLIINVCYNNKHILQLQSRTARATKVSYDMFSRTIRQLSNIEYLLTLLPDNFQLWLGVTADKYEICVSLTVNGNLPSLFTGLCSLSDYAEECGQYNLKKILLKYIIANGYYKQ